MAKRKRRRDFRGGGRYRNPQAWIDMVIATDPALANVTLLHYPRYSGRLVVFGRARLPEGGFPGATIIGRSSLVSRAELIDTIIHEETHHRLLLRARRGSARAKHIIKDIYLEEDYVMAVAQRFFRFKGLE